MPVLEPQPCAMKTRSESSSKTWSTREPPRCPTRQAIPPSRYRAPSASSRSPCPCFSTLTSATGRSSRCGSSTATSYSCLGRPPTTTSPSPTPKLQVAGIPLQGLDRLARGRALTTDDPYHKRARQIMLPAFHRERIAASIDTMVEETEKALEQWRPNTRIDLYAWTRSLATRIAMKALFGIDPDGPAAREIDAAAMFEQAWPSMQVATSSASSGRPVALGHAAGGL